MALLGNRRYKLYLQHQCLSNCPVSTDEIRSLLHDNTVDVQNSDSVSVLQSTPRCAVLRVRLNGQSLIVKIFTMYRFKDSFRHRRYGYSEWYNSGLAAKRNIRTPQPYVYFEKRKWGLVRQNGVVMEDLQGQFSELKECVAAGRGSYFDAIVPIRDLYRGGINHIDMSPSNILLAGDGRFAIIDWQYCSFYPQPSDLSLCMMAAVFLHYIGIRSDQEVWRQWLDQLYDQCRPAVSKEKLREAVAAMQSKNLHWTARLNLNVRDLGVEAIG